MYSNELGYVPIEYLKYKNKINKYSITLTNRSLTDVISHNLARGGGMINERNTELLIKS